MATKKYLDDNGLLYVWQKITAKFVAKEVGKGLSSNDFTTAEKTKLATVQEGATATTVDNGLSTTSENPVQNKVVTNNLNDKVDKVTGKGLSTNDYTTAEKEKLAGLSNYTLPTASASVLGGIMVGEGLTITAGVLSADISGDIPTKTSDLENDSDFVSDAHYVHTDNNFTTTLKNKLDGIEAGAEVNDLESISVNGTAQVITNKNVNISVPTNNNQLINGAGYQTASDVTSAIDAKLSSTYKAKGSVAFANLPSLTAANEGNVYNVTDDFTTTSDFVEGAGNSYPAGTNVVIINISGSTYKYDILSGFVDLSDYVLDSDLQAITNAEIDIIVS